MPSPDTCHREDLAIEELALKLGFALKIKILLGRNKDIRLAGHAPYVVSNPVFSYNSAMVNEQSIEAISTTSLG